MYIGSYLIIVMGFYNTSNVLALLAMYVYKDIYEDATF